MGVVVLHADQRGRSQVGGELGRQVLGVQVVGHDRGRDPGEAAEVVDGLEERPVGGQVLEVADVVAGHHGCRPWPPPPCSSARRPRPARGGGPAWAGRIGSGAYPRDRRTIWTAGRRRARRARTTESSQRMWMGRSWVRMASTMGPRRARASVSSWAMGSSDRLPLVITSGRSTPARSWWCSGV